MYQINTPETYDQWINKGPGLIDERLFSPEMIQLSQRYSQAVRDANEGREEHAYAAYESILERWPTFVAGRYNLANHLRHLGQNHDALRHLDVCHNLNPNDTDVLMLSGIIHGELGDPHAEVMYYQRVHAIDPRHQKAVQFLVITYRQLGWWTVARGWVEVLDALVQRKLDLDRRSVSREEALGLEWNLGLVHEHFGDLEEALEHFETAVHVSGGNYEGRMKVAEIKRRLGRA